MNGMTVPMNEEGHKESQEPIHDSILKNAPLPAPNAEVREKPARPMRQFTAAYKAFILRQAERCSTPGAIASLLRREGLYSSHLSRWRQQEAQALDQAFSPQSRGPKHRPEGSLVEENRKLTKQVAQLEKRLKQLEILIEVQKKLSELLESQAASPARGQDR